MHTPHAAPCIHTTPPLLLLSSLPQLDAKKVGAAPFPPSPLGPLHPHPALPAPNPPTHSHRSLTPASPPFPPHSHLRPHSVHQDDAEEPIVDADEFEALFLTKPAKSGPAPQLARGTSAGAGGSTLSLLDPKRANNLSIILSRSKLSFEQMRKAVLELNAEALTLTPTPTPTPPLSLAQPHPQP